MLTAVISDVKGLPPCQRITISLSGHLPSSLASLIGLLVASILCIARAWAMLSSIHCAGGVLTSQAVHTLSV